jgi:uncharacterized protein (TIGR02246 family)
MTARYQRSAFHLAALLCVAALLNPQMSGQARAQAACTLPTKEQIAALSEGWNRALATGTPAAVADFYAADAVLLPMLSSGPRMGREEIKSYFIEYLKRHPQGGINMRSIMVGCNFASDMGTYTYRLTGRRKGTREAIVGRYSTIYEFRDGKWLIVQQHSSSLGAK